MATPTEQLQRVFLESVTRELDQHLAVAERHEQKLQEHGAKIATNSTFVRVGIIATGLLLTANLALLGHLFNRIEILNRIIMQIQDQL